MDRHRNVGIEVLAGLIVLGLVAVTPLGLSFALFVAIVVGVAGALVTLVRSAMRREDPAAAPVVHRRRRR